MSDPVLDALLPEIIRLSAPEEIILYNSKTSPAGRLTSVKLCVIVSGDDARAVEHELYLSLDADIPFDLLVYSRMEWERLLTDRLSFACRIRETGRSVYEKK